MNKLFTTLLLFVFLNLEAQISKIKLTENQFKKIQTLQVSSNADSINQVYLDFKKTDTSFSAISDSDFLKITAILKPKNTNAYMIHKDSYDISHKIASDLVNDVSDDQNVVRIAVYFNKEPFFKQNLTKLIQNQFFDFYYNNNIMKYLETPNYIEVLRPFAVYKVVIHTKSESALKEEIDFIALNSNLEF